MNSRIEWIDLAKGMCIILVVIHHVICYGSGMDYELKSFFNSFRMPLYFILSGLFFKPYTLMEFLRKKVNKLLIPYLFFFLTLCVGFPLVAPLVTGYNVPCCDLNGIVPLLKTVFTENLQVDRPIWFLQCLLIMNVIFFTVVSLKRRIRMGGGISDMHHSWHLWNHC